MTDEDFIVMVRGAALGRIPTLEASMALARRVIAENVPGDFAEFGVFAGVHPAIFARAIQQSAPSGSRRVHLFDSFEGIPESGPKDDASITGCIGVGSGRLKSTGVSVCSSDRVRAYLRQWGVAVVVAIFHEGWFQHTLCDPGALAILRLDCDLYESTDFVLKNYYHRLSPGGVCISDDWMLTGARRATEEHFERLGSRPEIMQIPGSDGVVWWRAK